MTASCRYALIGLLAVMLLPSCYSPRYVYSPIAHNVPLIQGKGDSKLAAHYSVNLGENKQFDNYGHVNQGHGLDIQAAYAITDHLAVQGSYASRNEKNYADYSVNSSDTSLITYQRRSAELGVGYYTYMTARRNAVFQVFGGLSLGRSTFSDRFLKEPAGQEKYHHMDVTRLYLQPAIVIQAGQVYTTALSSRISLVYFRNISTNYTAEEQRSYQLEEPRSSGKIFWEPAFINYFGLKKLPGLKLELQCGLAFLMSQRFVDYRSFNFSAGFTADLPKLFSRKTKQSEN